MSDIKKKEKEFAIDEKGNTHEVIEFGGYKMREEYTKGRVIFAVVAFIVALNIIRGVLDNTALFIVSMVVVAITLRFLVLYVTVSEQELDRYKEKSAKSS